LASPFEREFRAVVARRFVRRLKKNGTGNSQPITLCLVLSRRLNRDEARRRAEKLDVASSEAAAYQPTRPRRFVAAAFLRAAAARDTGSYAVAKNEPD